MVHLSHSSCAAGAALVVLFVAAAGRADPAKTGTSAPSGYTYQFVDDLLAAGVFDASEPRIRVASHVIRTTLIRPRTAFVVEMLKSVENL